MENCNSLADILEMKAKRKGDDPIFIFRDKNHKREVITWREFYYLSERFAAILKNGGFDESNSSQKVSVKLFFFIFIRY